MANLKIGEFMRHYLGVAVGALDPAPGKQFILAGGEVPYDQCDCNGQVWARFVTMTPDITGPSKANGMPCGIMRWNVTLAVGVLRCVKGPTDRGTFPTGPQMTEDGDRFAADLAALTQAVVCDDLTASIVRVDPLGADGGCAGSEVQFSVRLNPCGCD